MATVIFAIQRMSAESQLLPLFALILATGVGAKILADRYKLPSIIFLLVAGVLLGPSGFGIITQQTFGAGLSSIVGFAVAIIVFDGAFNLKIDNIKASGSTTTRLVTIGAAIAFVGTAVPVKYLLGTEWSIAFLIGSLLVATGPTVITPILDVVSVPKNVETAMESEGIINDVTAAITAVVVFEVLVLSDATLEVFIVNFIQRIGVGVVFGIGGALIMYYIIKFTAGFKNAGQNARLLVLVGAVVTFAVADTVASEAGVAAVAVAGMLLGNLEVPYEEEIEEFKRDVTPVVLSLTFIVLAALVELQTIVDLGVRGVAVVILIVFVIRPLLVFVSATGSDFSRNEKLFISFVGPRGIIPASVATLFAVQLQAEGATAEASILVSTVFLVIFITVLLQGGFARYIAEALEVIPMKVIIIGGGTAGTELANKLQHRNEDIVIVENDSERVEELKAQGYPVIEGNGTTSKVLREAGADNAKIIVAMTENDDANLLAAQLGDVEFGVPSVMARVNNPDSVETFEKLGVRTVAAPSATATAVDNLIERPAITDWMDDLKDRGDVQDVVIESDDMDGVTVEELGEILPKEVIITLVTTENDAVIPTADLKVNKGDRLTMMGERAAVEEAFQMFR